MKKKKLWLLYPVLALLLAFSLAMPVSAEEGPVPLPHNFYGSVTIGTEPAPAETEVEARGEGVMTTEANPITTTVEGQYGGPGPTEPKLEVQGYIEEGTPIEFYIDEVRAQCREHGTGAWLDSYPWHSTGMTELDLTVTVEVGAPEVTTNAATDVTTDSAILNGNLDSLGDYSSVDVSFEWGTISGALDQETSPPETMTSTGPFSAPISGLDSNTTYYFRAKATGSVTVYGAELSFTTTGVGAPEVTTNAATDVTTESATLKGSLDSLGDYTSVDVSFEWGTTSGALDQETSPPETMTSTGPFSAPISGLDSNTTYYFRAKATGSVTVYGDELSFITLESPPLMYLGLSSGWNIFSTPIALDSDSNSWGELVAMGGLDVEIAYYYDGLGQIWGQVLSNYVMAPCDAIYVNMGSAGTVPIYPSPDPSVSSKELYPDWNLVGLAALENMGVVEALTSVYVVTGDLTGYSQVISPPINQPDWFYIRDGGDNPLMLVGKGYWVFMINGGTLGGFTTTPIE